MPCSTSFPACFKGPGVATSRNALNRCGNPPRIRVSEVHPFFEQLALKKTLPLAHALPTEIVALRHAASYIWPPHQHHESATTPVASCRSASRAAEPCYRSAASKTNRMFRYRACGHHVRSRSPLNVLRSSSNGARLTFQTP
jgi:hypothetical protein